MTIKIKEKSKQVVSDMISPKGTLVGFNAVTAPSTKFNVDGVYSANILISKADGEAIIAEAKAVGKEQFKTFGKGTTTQPFTKCKPYVIVEKNEDGEVTKETPDAEGRYILKTDMKAKIHCKDNSVIDIKIPMFDSKGKPVKGAVNLGEGSVVKLAYDIKGYSVAGKTGVGCKLKSLQLISLVEYAGGNFGFGEEDGDFDAADAVEETKSTETTEEDEETADF